MSRTHFVQLNHGWNAEPNAPEPTVKVEGPKVTVLFRLNPFEHQAEPGERGLLTFTGCSRWRLGPTNDEGWYGGHCLYSETAPRWGEFYEVASADPAAQAANDWHFVASPAQDERHFLFYFRDETFECSAGEWALARGK